MKPHTFTNIAVVFDDDAEVGDLWRWCIRCGILELNGEFFYYGEHQNLTITGDDSNEDKGCV